jgi:hypothetical protein
MFKGTLQDRKLSSTDGKEEAIEKAMDSPNCGDF